MNKTNKVVASTKAMSKLERAKFGPGMLLQHEDLEQLNMYTRELSRLLFRSFFGCGVICGLEVTAEVDRCNKVFVTVGAGLALDCSGDPVHVPQVQHFAIDENCCPDLPDPLWVVLCGATKHCAPRTAMCTDDDDKATSVCTRERDMFEIRVVSERPKCVCGCAEPSSTAGDKNYGVRKVSLEGQADKDPCLCADPTLDCHANHYAGKCGCACDDGSNCDCQCILLAQLSKNDNGEGPAWCVDHRVRRFIRPVLMRDPLVDIDQRDKKCYPAQAATTQVTKQTLAVEQVASDQAEVAQPAAEKPAKTAKARQPVNQ
jgi:hypothetical protein